MEIDNGLGGQFMPVYGTLSDSLSLQYAFVSGVRRGLVFRARYRARNVNGWGEYSPIGYILAAVKPDAPPAPVFISATSTTITLNLWPSLENGGS
jgi:hypothetical protein